MERINGLLFYTLNDKIHQNAKMRTETMGDTSENVICHATETYPRYNNGTVLPLENGSLLLLCQEWYTEAIEDYSACRIIGKISKDKGRTWSSSYIVKE